MAAFETDQQRQYEGLLIGAETEVSELSADGARELLNDPGTGLCFGGGDGIVVSVYRRDAGG